MKNRPFVMQNTVKTVHTSLGSRVDFKGKVSAEKDFVRNCFSEVSSRRTGDKKSERKRRGRERERERVNHV